MEDANVWTNWYVGLVISCVVILAAAILLLLVWQAARRILRLAKAALGLVVQIKGNTQSIWNLAQTNEVAVDILEGAKDIESHATLVAEALHETENKN